MTDIRGEVIAKAAEQPELLLVDIGKDRILKIFLMVKISLKFKKWEVVFLSELRNDQIYIPYNEIYHIQLLSVISLSWYITLYLQERKRL